MKKKNIIMLISIVLLLSIIVTKLSEAKSFKEVTPAKINETSVYIDMVVINYASKDRVIFSYGDVLFVYDVNEEEVYRSLDMNHIYKGFVNGSTVLFVEASNDGNYAYFYNIGDDFDGFMYKYDIEADKVKKMKYEKIEDRYQVLLTGDIKPDGYEKHEGAHSPTICRLEDGTLVYLVLSGVKLKELQVIFLNESNQSKKVYDVFSKLSM